MNDSRWGEKLLVYPTADKVKVGTLEDADIGDSIVAIVDGEKEFELEKKSLRDELEKQLANPANSEFRKNQISELLKTLDDMFQDFFGNVRKIKKGEEYTIDDWDFVLSDDEKANYLYIIINQFRDPDTEASKFQYMFPAYYFEKKKA